MDMSLEQIKLDLLSQVEAANDLAAIEEVRVKTLGKKGMLTSLMQGLKDLTPEERKQRGQDLNLLKQDVVVRLEEKIQQLNAKKLEERLATETMDATLPVRELAQGRIHPITQTIEEITQIFAQMGFAVAEGPDIEDDWHNFTALNIPEEHPARQMHDTFYLPPEEEGTSNRVLRTHTSPVQIRTMENQEPPIKIIAPGRTYRSDYDQTHTPMFHQVEGLLIDGESHFGHLKGCLLDFCRQYFELPDLQMRFRPSYFPFTEPSAEIDINCAWKDGQLIIGGGDDWMEIGGCGMVNPKVLENSKIDPDQYQGFAFGMGVERMAMLKYGIPDLRTFFESDVRWLQHYGFFTPEVPR